MVYIDQMNRQCVLDKIPERIVSLVPSQSQLLWDLGLKDQLAGITKFCIHPEEMFRSVPRVGGTKQIHLDKIRALKPDLIIGNKEENTEADILALEKEFPVWMSDIYTLDDAINMIQSIGEITNTAAKAIALTESIARNFAQLDFPSQRTCIYLIWNEPMMVCGKNNFIDDMLQKAGFRNGIEGARYPMLTEDELSSHPAEYILLSTEPFPFGEEHVVSFQKKFPEKKVVLVDAEFFSWYGSKLNDAPNYFKQLRSSLNIDGV
jgi:ABC-type Fe3+-hydroxamate transport system substrate-binding protein